MAGAYRAQPAMGAICHLQHWGRGTMWGVDQKQGTAKAACGTLQRQKANGDQNSESNSQPL
eukprot:10582342-Karenia_brevis.AAC.1